MPRTVITRREAAELTGITEMTVKKAIDQKVVPTRRGGTRSWIELEDVPVLAMLGQLNTMRLTPAQRRARRKWLRTSRAQVELELVPALVVRQVEAIEQARQRAQLRHKWIVRHTEIRNGEPVIRGSRVSVHTLADGTMIVGVGVGVVLGNA